MFERFTSDARAVITQAQREAYDLRHERIGTEHVLLGLLAQDGRASAVLRALGVELEPARASARRRMEVAPMDADALASIGVDLGEVTRRVEAAFGPGALRRGLRGGRCRRPDLPRAVPLTPRSKRVLEQALREALRLQDRHIGSEHLLLALVADRSAMAVAVLADQGVSTDAVRAAVLRDRAA